MRKRMQRTVVSPTNGRYEIKHSISRADYFILRSRLRSVLFPDPNAGQGGFYLVRSLYFDTPDDRALLEKLNGVRDRDKYRLRYYNFDKSFIRLEKKSRRGGLGIKTSASLTESQARAIADGRGDWLGDEEPPLLAELDRKMREELLRPRTIVDYVREPFVFPAGDVRVTLDHHIRTGLSGTDFLDPNCVTVPLPDDPIILEVKWSHYLPDIVRDVVSAENRSGTAFSKYAACRAVDY